MLKSNKIQGIRAFIISMMTVLFFAASAWATFLLMPDNATQTASADDTSVTVTVKDLMARHGVDYAIGPIKNTTINGKTYNNEFGIESGLYFDADKYLYTTNNGTVLRGFKAGIKGTYPNLGAINSDGSKGGDAGPFIYYPENDEADSCKYVIIVPDKVTTIGTSTNGMSQDGSTYTDFGHYHFNRTLGDDSYYQPRERVGGFYFTNKSELTTIEGGDDKKKTNGKIDDGTYGAISSCDNLRFCVLPSNGKLKTIGKYALRGCSQMRDFNLPASITTLGNGALAWCGMPHLTIPKFTSTAVTIGTSVFEGTDKLRDVQDLSGKFSQNDFSDVMNYYTTASGSKLYAVGTVDGDTGIQAIYFCKNSIRRNTFATISNANQAYKNGWYAIGLAGLEDKGRTKIYDLPATVSANDARRTDILYDFLNPDGTGYKNTLTENITSYDIADKMCYETWCGNVRIPNTVKVIGDYAFSFSHAQYVEIAKSVTHIGRQAFYYNDRRATARLDYQQYYYIHGSPSTGTSVFEFYSNASASNKVTRNYIFEDQTLYNSIYTSSIFSTSKANYTIVKTYQVPIKAVVESTDGDVNIVGEEMSTRFNVDSDYYNGTYKSGPANKGNGTYTITYTKRLNNLGYTYVKQENGAWANRSDDTIALMSSPTIEGMTSTKWFTNNTYSSSATAWGQYSNNKTIYTKKLGAPTAVNQSYTYGNEVKEGVTKSFNATLNLSKDSYTVELVSYTDWGNNEVLATSSNAPKEVVNAGHYIVRVNISSKWGTWADSKANENQYSIDVAQAEINLNDINNMPDFTVEGMGASLGGTGEGATLRRYSDGWYLYEKSGTPVSTITVLNSFTRFTGSPIAIAASSGSLPYTVQVIRNSGTVSGDYVAEYNLILPSTYNYKFISGNPNASLYNLHGLGFDISNNGQQASITKHWYIVTQGNWLIDSSSTATGDALLNESFTLITIDNVGTSTWSYETDSFIVHTPKLAYGVADIKFEVYYGVSELSITPENTPQPITDLKRYINSAMPAGRYTVLITAPEVELEDGTKYPAINERIIINVTASNFTESEIQAVKNALTNKTFEHCYNAQVYLPNEKVEAQLKALNDTLNSQRKLTTAGVWSDTKYNGYYDTASITYNLDDMRSSEYLANPGMPISVGEYTVYYSVSALNYVTIGGSDNADRRNYVFTTVIYDVISASGFNIGDFSYTGNVINPTIPYSPYYNYSYVKDADYTNAREGCIIKVEITDKKLYRWSDSNKPDNVTFGTGTETGIATVTFNILKANNGWQAAPQMPSWTYNGFDADVYTISSLHNFYQLNLTVYYRLHRAIFDENGEVEGWEDWVDLGQYGITFNEEENYFTVDANGKVNANIAKILNGLIPGTYSLVSRISGNNNINELSEMSYARIIIGKATNSWTTSPNIIPWTWGNYNSSVNEIAAVAEYDEEVSNITYSILYAGSKEVVEGLASFKSVTADIENIFKALPAGNYILRTELNGTDYYGNMNPSNINFTISQAQNYWAKTPSVIRWKWSEYNSSVNLITATPAYSAAHNGNYGVNEYASPVVKYTILNSKYELPNAILKNFGSTNGVVSAEVAAVLAGLPVGTYYLIPCLESRNNYSAINANALNYDFSDKAKNESLVGAGIEFNISIIANSWETAPNMTGWNYKGFNKTANFIVGDPVFKVTNAKVHYTVTSAEGTVIAEFDTIDTVVSSLTTLPVGSYSFKATYDGTTNFEKLEKTGGFIVSYVSNNTWTTAPAITGWVYGSFKSSNVTSVADSFGSAISYTVVKDGETEAKYENYTFSALITELAKNNLDAGLYKLTVKGAQTTNYNVLTADLDFEIAKAVNEWSTRPEISGWTYGATASTPATGATKQPNSGLESSYYTVVRDGAELSLDEKLDRKPSDAGSYAYVTVAGASTNYRELTYVSYFSIAQATNSWSTLPNITGWIYGEAITEIEFVPEFDVDGTLTYYIDGEEVNTSSFAATFANLNAGPHTVRAEVTETPNYTGLITPISFTVFKATNSWRDELTLDTSFSDTEWEWKDEVSWSGLKPRYGFTVYVTITKDGTSAADSDRALFYVTIDYSAENAVYTKTIESVSEALTLLDAGSYRLTVTAPSDDNWNEFTKSITLKVNKAKNGWEESGAPSITSSWVYGTTGATPSADSKHGDVIIKYYTRDDSGNRTAYGTQQPVNAGSYEVGFSVIESDNYLGITETYLNFTIEKSSDPSFIVYPSVVGWVWNTYDREVNLFSGIPRTGGEVSYSVLLNGNVVEVDGTKLENITLVGLDDTFNNNLNEDLYVRKSVGELLAKLTANAYTLRVSVAATQNYVGFPTDIRLDVTAAENVWEITPQVVPWAVYYWTSDSTPKAEPRFGIATITITSAIGNREYYRATYNSETKETGLITNDLQDAPAGWYYLEAKVPALPGCYNNALGERVSERIEFQIFVEGNTTQDNYWRVMPRIADWTANSDGEHSDPVGEPLRGKAYFSFYTAVRINGVWTKVDAIDETNGTKVTVSGSYGYDYYVPIKNGDYIMVARGEFRDQSGEVVESDAPETLEVHFEVLKRINSFTAEPRIETLLYLGDRANWEKPTAEVLEGYVTYSYRLWGTDDEFSEEIRITDETDIYKLLPGDPGVYELKATGHALYADDIYKYVKFEVKLSPNSWLSSPSIKDWSEEVDPNNPFGEAAVGSEYIEYMYASIDKPDAKFKTKPREEGTYIVYATLAVEGYETITSEYTFTITAAFDRQLLILDIILGIVACASAVVVIYFAVRRYKENG